MHEKTLIIGSGEVGTGLRGVLESEYIVAFLDHLNGYYIDDDSVYNKKVIHICFPWSDKFDKHVNDYIKQLKPSLCIIHSTIPLDSDIVKRPDVAFSPVRGVHPNLCDGIRTFVKVVAGESEKSVKKARDHLEKVGIQTIGMTVKEAILAKLLSTTYYGVCIAYAKYVKNICDEDNADFDKVYTLWNRTYNAGYMQLGMPEVVRPVLYPPREVIGGHCVKENAKILDEFFPSPFLDMIQNLKLTNN